MDSEEAKKQGNPKHIPYEDSVLNNDTKSRLRLASNERKKRWLQ